MNVLDLFSGIGGFSLGLERAGMRTVAFCEIDPYCRSVLAKHWPDVPVWGDVRTLTTEWVVAHANGNGHGNPAGSERAGLPTGQVRGDFSSQVKERQSIQGEIGRRGIDVICGGFPCQDISVAGKGAGIEGSRSGLWGEYARVIGEVRPRYVIVENVAALLGRGLERVLGDLASLGFDCEWHCIPASAVGAPHRRDRVWIIAYSDRQGEHGFALNAEMASASELMADTGRLPAQRWRFDLGAIGERNWWHTEPDVGRVAHGVPARVDRLKSLGNAVVPQIPEIIGRAIMGLGATNQEQSEV